MPEQPRQPRLYPNEFPPVMEASLVRTKRWRRVETYATFMLIIVATLFATILLVSFLGEPELRFKLIPLGGAVVLTPIWGVTWSQFQLAFGPPGSIVLTSSEVIIDSPRWFRVPLRIPLGQVHGASFEEGVERGWYESLELNPFRERTNLTIFLDPPLKIPPKTARLFQTTRGNIRERSFLYLLGRVENVSDARVGFEQVSLGR